MITLRRTTCFILSLLFLSACAFVRGDVPDRIVRVKALADPKFRERNPQWREELRALVEASSDYFEREFGVRFVTHSTDAWPAEERIPSTAGLLARLKRDFPLDKKDESYDLIIAFTAERVSVYFGGKARVDRIGNCREGLGNYVVTSVSEPFRYGGTADEPVYDVVALIHELGHIFGAEHIQDTNSVMHENFDYRTEFDMKNRGVIIGNKLCPFQK